MSLGPDDHTPNPDGALSVDRLWTRVRLLEDEMRKAQKNFEEELRKLRNDFNKTTESMKDDVAGFGVRMELLEEDMRAMRDLVTEGNEVNKKNNVLLVNIDDKLNRLGAAK